MKKKRPPTLKGPDRYPLKSLVREARDVASMLDLDADQWAVTAAANDHFRRTYEWQDTVDLQRKASNLIRRLQRAIRTQLQ